MEVSRVMGNVPTSLLSQPFLLSLCPLVRPHTFQSLCLGKQETNPSAPIFSDKSSGPANAHPHPIGFQSRD